MAKFNPQKIRISGEDAKKLWDCVRDDYDALKAGQFEQWKKLLKAYRVGPVGVMSNVQTDRFEDVSTQGLALISSVIQSMKPYMFYSDPSIYAEAKKVTEEGDEELRARLAQAGLSHQWQEGAASNEVDKVLDDVLIFGTGFVREAYQPSGEFVPVENYDTDFDEDEQIDDSEEAVLLRDRLEQLGFPVDKPQAHTSTLRLSPFNVIPPAGFDEIHKMPRLSVRHLIEIDRVKNDPRFANTSHLVADMVPSLDKIGMDDGGRTRRGVGGKPTHVEVWEIWHPEWRRRKVYADGKKKWKMVKEMHVTWLVDQHPPAKNGKASDGPTILRNHVSALDMEGYPFIDIRFERVPDAFYGLSLANQLLPVAIWIQEMIDAGVSGMRAAMNQKVLYHEQKLGKNGLQLLNKPFPCAVPVKDKMSAGNAVSVLQLPAFPQEYHGFMNMLSALISRISGSDEAVQGGRSSAGSATEVAFRASVLKGRSEYKLKIFEKFLDRILRKKLQLMQQFFDADRWARITGEDEVVAYNRHQIRGEYDVGVHSGSTRPRGPEVERQAMIGFLEAFGAAIQTMQAAQVPPEVTADVVGKISRLWEQNMPSMMDSFAQMVGQGVRSVGQAPPAAEGSTAEGNATNPMTGESLTVPAAGRLQAVAAAGGLPPQ